MGFTKSKIIEVKRFRHFTYWGVAIIILVGCSSHSKITYGVAPVEEGANLSIREGGAINLKAHHYTVHKGDTLYSLAWALGVDYRDLARTNGLHPPYALHQGQRLNLRMSHTKRRAAVAPSRRKPAHKKINVHKNGHKAAVYQGRWRWPAHGHINRRFWRAKASGEHGVDIAGHSGEAIRASAAGRIVYSGKGIRGYGNLLIIKHNASLLSAYAYNARLFVKTGDRVTAGQKIALMGRSPTGQPLLHFEIRENGKPVNQRYYRRLKRM